MSVSGNETAIKSLGSQANPNVAGVPMKKRRFIWPSSPTPEETSVSLVDNVALEKQICSPCHEAKPAVTSWGLSDTSDMDKGFALEENKKGSVNIVPANSCLNNSSFKIQEASLAVQSDSLAKSDDDEKLAVTEKSATIMTGMKPLGGVPMKKRRFVHPSSPPHENPSVVLAGSDFRKKEHDSLLETSPSSASVEGSSGRSDLNKKDLPEKNKISDNMVEASVVTHSRVKIEEVSPRVCSDSLAKVDNKKLLTSGKYGNVILKSADTELNLAPNKLAALSLGNEQIAEGKSKGKSVASGNHELSLGLTGSQPSAAEDNCHDSSRKQGNLVSFSLNLSLSNDERNSQHKVDEVQSNTGICDVFGDRSNWDLNTTMDAWEASVNGATGKVVPDAKPLIPLGMVKSSIGAENHIFDERECRTSFTRTLSETGVLYNSEDSLHLRLSPSSTLFNRQETFDPSANKESHIAVPNISLPADLFTGSQTVHPRIVKSEPIEESVQIDLCGSKANSMPLLGFRAVPMKSEYVEKPVQEVLKLPNSSPGQPMKSEPILRDNLERPKTADGMSRKSGKEVLQSHDLRVQSTSSTSEHALQVQDIKRQSTCVTNEFILQVQDTTGQSGCSANEHLLHGEASHGKSNCSTDEKMPQGLYVHGNRLDHSVHGGLAKGAHFKNEAPKESCESAEKVALELSAHLVAVGHSGDENNGSCAVGHIITEEKSADVSDRPVPHQTGECAVSDEEKINLSGDILEEDSYGSEYESDGNSVPMDIEEDGRGQDDYEDGEVREPRPDAAVEGPVCDKTGDASHGDSDCKKATSELHGDLHSSADIVRKDSEKEQPVEAKKDAIVDADTAFDRKPIDAEKDASLEESAAVEISSDGNFVKTVQTNMQDLLSLNKDENPGTEQFSDQAACVGRGTLMGGIEGLSENVNDVDKDESMLQKVETSVNVDDEAKDANSGGNQSRIINLSIASNMSSYGKARTISGKPFSLRPGRERLPDMPLEGERLHLRGREEAYTEGSHNFSKDRYRDRSSRNSRWNFVHGRGRISTLRNDRDFDRDCVPRHKYTSAVSGSDTEYMNFNVGQDSGFGNNNVRGGRKLLEDETPLFRQFASRRRSPGARDGPPVSRGLQMVRRGPRSIGEDNSESVGPRHVEKMMRGYPDDSEEQHGYAARPFEGLDGRFRNFSNVHRRGSMAQMRSKSPIRSRSPGPWSSRRRSPDAFGELHHRRSPIYRMERIRSPNNPGFPTDRVPRRHGSPSYMARPNDMREMDHGGHPRSIVSNRSPNGQVLLRNNNRRFNIVDPRERAENEEFFGGPGRLDDRRGHVRPFRPSFNGTDNSDNFHINSEDGGPGHRSFRYFTEDNKPKSFHEQRAREFDRRMKNRPGNNGPRRPISMEEQEGNFRHGGQVMNDDGFDDMSRVKRKRF